MLDEEKLVAMLGTTKPEAARAFFEGTLGLPFVEELPHALYFDSNGTRLMVQKLDQVTPPHGTALGWNVGNMPEVMRGLIARGVAFERFEGMQQDEIGIWSPHPGAGVAWFKDPDGNLLSLSQSSGL
jgi:catechol 2,3-dioxygenase-like lactoylglutathione lyase family enzyme